MPLARLRRHACPVLNLNGMLRCRTRLMSDCTARSFQLAAALCLSMAHVRSCESAVHTIAKTIATCIISSFYRHRSKEVTFGPCWDLLGNGVLHWEMACFIRKCCKHTKSRPRMEKRFHDIVSELFGQAYSRSWIIIVGVEQCTNCLRRLYGVTISHTVYYRAMYFICFKQLDRYVIESPFDMQQLF